MKKFIVVTIAFYFLFQINNLSFSQESRWVQIAASEEFQSIYYVDKSSIICDEYHCINTWLKTECFSNCYESNSGKTIKYILENFRVHIGKRELTSLSYVYYFTDGSNYSNTYHTGTENVIPDSIGEELYNYIIKRYSCK